MQDISPQELKEKVQTAKNFILLDVREAEEREISRLPNDVHIPLGELGARLGELDPGAEIVVYCRTGNRSGRAAAWMAHMGYRNVWNLAGGINQWAREIDPSLPTY